MSRPPESGSGEPVPAPTSEQIVKAFTELRALIAKHTGVSFEEDSPMEASDPHHDRVNSWRCFHCKAFFADDAAARAHFGEARHEVPECQRSYQMVLEAMREAQDLRQELEQMRQNRAASPGGEPPTSDRDELRAVFVEGALWRGQQKAISADSLMKEVARRDRDGFFSAGPSTSGEPPTLTSLQLRAAAKVGADKVAPLGAHCSGDGWVAFNAWLEQRFPSGLGEPVPPEAPDTDRIYPCDMCGVLRSKNEGGTVFTVCDDCWKIAYPSKPGVSGGGVSSPGEPDAIAKLRESLHKERDLDHSDEFGADERRTDALLESVSRELEGLRQEVKYFGPVYRWIISDPRRLPETVCDAIERLYVLMRTGKPFQASPGSVSPPEESTWPPQEFVQPSPLRGTLEDDL